jgi:hypothetical protein
MASQQSGRCSKIAESGRGENDGGEGSSGLTAVLVRINRRTNSTIPAPMAKPAANNANSIKGMRSAMFTLAIYVGN